MKLNLKIKIKNCNTKVIKIDTGASVAVTDMKS